MSRIDKLRSKIAGCDGYYITGKANIFYYSGFTSEDASLLITRNEQIIITDSRYFAQANAECPNFEIFDISKGISNLFKKLNYKKIGFEADYITYADYKLLEVAISPTELFMADSEISALRQVKDEEEIKKISEAERLGDEAFSHILKIIRAGMTEKEVAFELESYMRKNGASATSFETIVASGIRSALPHGRATDKVIEKGDFVTMDFGCILDGYCSDMTRTVAIGSVTETQKEIYNVVLKAQTKAIEAVKVGINCSDIDKVARDVITNAGYGKYFGHSLGHSVGLEIHENPNFSPKSKAITETGNVITVEPGIYIEGFCGVRIEDIMAILPKNAANLTKSEKNLIII